MITIATVAIPGSLHSALHGIGEILYMANKLAGKKNFNYSILSPGVEQVSCYTGTLITPENTISNSSQDIIIIPPILENMNELIDDKNLISWLKEQHKSGSIVATVCAGSFLLAETGILNGRYATTHWNLGEKFKERYPDVKLNIQRLLIDGGNYICAGGVSAWMDLALYLVKRYLSIEDSLNCAKVMLMDPHREYQSPYGLGGFPKSHNDRAILNVQAWLEVNYPESPNLALMAEKANLSQRSLLRRFKKATGCSPIQYLRQVRVDAAQMMLEQTDDSVESISEYVGYTDYSTFRKLFKQTIGMTPSTYRQKFGLRI